MNTQRPSARPLAFLVLMLAAAALAAGCKPGLLKQAEKLAGQIKRETGTPQKLRSWFNEVQSEPNTAKPKQLAIPASLGSVWASGTTAYPAWAEDGTLQTITLTRDGFEFITIGPLRANPKDFRLGQNHGEPLSFYAPVADGIFAWVPSK